MERSNWCTYPMPHGPLTIAADDKGLTALAFGAVPLLGRNAPSILTNRAATEIQEYFAGKRRSFDVRLSLRGSAFQRTVWTEILSIPYGEERTCEQLARLIGKPGSHRSVGTAVKSCPLPLIVPTHRVVGKNREPFGHDRSTQVRRGLLAFEQKTAQRAPSADRIRCENLRL
ncbi:methylated-DNA--[protein]-cysteine S-methyltransferase [Gordonibacter sp. Marseille-P4307]|uniref:methylated-DNA--[protein]-cysteine S-methyltransferase n=1 Tax=Gordonibacter sp. Marseille-P4307 TaxID=2161815 RepID=UPI000F546E8C|nr:methylated-DNA--[protein]-cysteine S-methyltransferase [Gordonibacter sp. Marseille-P4307]